MKSGCFLLTCDKNTVCIRVVLHAGLLQYPLYLLVGEVVVHLHLEVQLSQHHPQVVPKADTVFFVQSAALQLVLGP